MKATLSLKEHQARGRRGDTDVHYTEGALKALDAVLKQVGGKMENVESFKAFRAFAYQNADKIMGMREATPSAAFAQLFRAGVQTSTNGWYENTQVEYEKYTMMETTNMRMEFWAPLYGSQFPTLTPEGQPYSETGVQGQDIEFIPQKFMGGESFARELFDDDQTGQIKQRMQKLGASARQREEMEMAGRLQNTALTFGNATIPLTNYKTTNAQQQTITGPFSTTIYGTRNAVAYGNKPASFVQLSVPAIKAGLTARRRAFDPQGVPLLVQPDVLVVSPEDSLNARAFMTSTLYPAIQGQAGTTSNTATSGLSGGPMTDNFLKGMLDICENVYLAPWAWNIGCKGKGLMFVRRDPLEVVQEVPNSGASFNTDTIRFRTRSRYRGDWNDARFWYQGNDGSVTGVQ